MTILLKPPSVKLTLHSEPKFTFKTKTKNLFSSLSNNIKKDRCLEEQENILRYRGSISSVRTKYNVSRVVYFYLVDSTFTMLQVISEPLSCGNLMYWKHAATKQHSPTPVQSSSYFLAEMTWTSD